MQKTTNEKRREKSDTFKHAESSLAAAHCQTKCDCCILLCCCDVCCMLYAHARLGGANLRMGAAGPREGAGGVGPSSHSSFLDADDGGANRVGIGSVPRPGGPRPPPPREGREGIPPGNSPPPPPPPPLDPLLPESDFPSMNGLLLSTVTAFFSLPLVNP